MVNSAYETGAIEVAKGVYGYIQADGATNAGFIVEEGGVVIIDTLMTRTLADRLMSEIRKVTNLPVKYIVNTHWHGDHTYGNALFPGVPIIAHNTCRDDLLQEWEAHRMFLSELYPEASNEFESLPAMPPNVTFSHSMSLNIGSRPIELIYYGRAHTRGDIAIYLPSEGVLFAGDLAFHKYIPNARDGYPSDWMRVAAQVQELPVESIIPGHGPIGKRKDLIEMRECLELIVGGVRNSYDNGLDEFETYRSLALGAFASWGRQEDRIPTLIKRLYGEFSGLIK